MRNKDREDFMLKGTLSELDWEPKTEEQIRVELFKGTDPDKMMDAYEEQMGIKPKTVAKQNLVYKFVYLSPCSNDEDGALLQKFYNNPDQYIVLNRADYWTPKGEIKIFIEYHEDLDVRKKKEQQAQQAEEE